MKFTRPYRRERGFGSSVMFGIGTILTGLMLSSLAIDMGTYYTVQRQLQTAVDSAALAGARDLPMGQSFAEDSALEYAQMNEVAANQLEADNLDYVIDGTAFQVNGEAEFETTMSKLFCNGKLPTLLDNGDEEEGQGSSGGGDCSRLTVKASSKAEPAARDTMLVIDTSNSMDDLGNNRPLVDVKNAAKKYIDMIAAFNSQSIDRIGLVTFDKTGTKKIGLTSQQQSVGFASVKTKVDQISLFSGTGWNTNYEPGLRLALDELQNNGRPNADKIIVFMTDGMPNLPGPAAYNTYNSNEPYRKCTDPVHNATEFKQTICNYTTSGGKRVYSNCRVNPNIATTRNGNTVTVPSNNEAICSIKRNGTGTGYTGSLTYSNCKSLPHDIISEALIKKYSGPSTSGTCGKTYTDYMEQVTQAQVTRAEDLDVTIHAVVITDADTTGSSIRVLQQLIYEPDWDPGLTQLMASATNGQHYTAENYDAAAITDIYEEIASNIHIRLTN